MKLLRFSDEPAKAQLAYNEWAKDKPISRDVIVHTHINSHMTDNYICAVLTILVFYDEKLHTNW